MRARSQLVALFVFVLVVGFYWQPEALLAQVVLESPAFSDPALLAVIFTPPSNATNIRDVPRLENVSGPARLRGDFKLSYPKAPIPENCDAFEERFGVEKQEGRPHLQLLENGMHKINETIFSIKLFERRVNSLLNLEYSLHELAGYDSRSKENELDNFFDHAKLKTDFDWDAPVGLYVGLRFQIKCYSIFQFWK